MRSAILDSLNQAFQTMDPNKEAIEHRSTIPEALVVEIRPAAGGMAQGNPDP
jgi:hypothetical protein